jgi:hypothetical protein
MRVSASHRMAIAAELAAERLAHQPAEAEGGRET